jgi:hypothetical protein
VLATWQILDAATAARKRLLRAGYFPIPTNGKKPPIAGWTGIVATDATIESWFSLFPEALNTGILTRTTPAVDVDVYDPDVAAEIEAALWDMIGSRCMVRFGQPPKRAILFRTGTSFAKISTPIFTSPSQQQHRVEVLCDGQQIVVLGNHPGTGKPSSWHGGEPGDVARADLPELTHAMADEFITKAAAIMQAQGWVEASRKLNDAVHDGDAGDGFDAIYGNREQKYAQAALKNAAAELASALQGGRNELLNAKAYAMGRMVGANWIGRTEVADALWRASEQNGLVGDDGAESVRATLDSGLNKGLLKPHEPLAERGVSLNDFFAYMPEHSYIFVPTRAMWPASSVNSLILPIPVCDADGKPVLDNKGEPKMMPANAWIDRHRHVEQMTWAPGLPRLISGRLVAEGGWLQRDGVSCFNLYLPPAVEAGDATQAGPWLEHVRMVYPDDAEHIFRWLAHRVQRPHVKTNHALVLGGCQGIGKDTLLEPVKYAVGAWNFFEASPQQVLGRFNGFLKSVILRISEARDLGDMDRFKFYDHLKTITAAPPDVLRVDEKHVPEHAVLNVCGIIITSNYKTDGIYLPADDRRHFVAWSDLLKDDFTPEYWNKLWGWYADGGIRHVAAYLSRLDISGFDAKAPPPKTAAFWAIADANRAPEDAELADVLDKMGNPDATTIEKIASMADGEIQFWIMDRKNRRQIPHRLEGCGYVPVRNEAAKDGLWKIRGARQVVYAKSSMTIRDRFLTACKYAGRSW